MPIEATFPKPAYMQAVNRSLPGWQFVFQCACYVVSLLLCGYLLVSAVTDRSEFGSERLYWEYSGRILGADWTPGFPEWVQFRAGPLPGVSADAATKETLPPYSGFVAEYPPGALLYFTALRRVFSDFTQFATAHNTLMCLSFILSFGLALVSLRDRLVFVDDNRARISMSFAALACPIMIYLIGSFITSRFDALTAALTAAAVLATQRDKPAAAGLMLGFAGAVKLWPLFLLPFLIAKPRGYLTLIAYALGVFIACHAILLTLGTAPADLLGYLTYASDRPVHSESFLAFVSYLISGPVDLVYNFGSWGLAGEGGIVTARFMQYGYVALLAAFAVSRLAMDFRPPVAAKSLPPRATMTRDGVLQLGAISLLLVMSKAFSGEYMIWIMPLALAATSYAWGLPLLFALLAMLGVKLGYIFTEDTRSINQAEISVFALKWLGLLGIVACSGTGLLKWRNFRAGK